VPRLCFNLYPGICLTTEENLGKPQSGHPKSARLFTAERESFSRLGHRLAMASTGLPTPLLLAFASGDGSAVSQRKYLSSCRNKGFPTSANFESKLAVRALMWSVSSGTPKSS
jgi:hypothetical protein